MTDDIKDDEALDRLFAEARAKRASPSPDFMARLHVDAEAAMPRPVAAGSTAPRWSWLSGVFAVSGLSGAALTGVWIGFAMPEALDTLDFSTDTSFALSTFLPASDLGAVFDE